MGRVVGCGFNHPHSLSYVAPHLYLCSSAVGVFHICRFVNEGILTHEFQYKLTDDHFLRGAYRVNSGWFLGGSTVRHGQVISQNMEVYYLNEATGEAEKKVIGESGEIYDILPWKEEILEPIIKRHFSD